jgi:hypothetical protein
VVRSRAMIRKSDPPKSEQQVPDYDFSGGVRGKYAARYAEGTNVVVLPESPVKRVTARPARKKPGA